MTVARKSIRNRPGVVTLEGRTLLSTSAGGGPVAPGAEAYVTQLYFDLLGRAPDPGGLATAAEVAGRGRAGRDSVARGILGSPEYRDRAIDGLYRDLLGREADPVGLAAFRQVIAGRGSDGVRSAILASDEYFAAAGGGNEEFVRSLVTDVLGRPMSRAEGELLLGPGAGRPGPLDRGVPRSRVVSFVVDGAEAERRVVDEAFEDLLLRRASTGEARPYVAALRGGRTPEDIVRVLATSPEYVDQASDVTLPAGDRLDELGVFSTLMQVVQRAGLGEYFHSGGPFTLFAPTDEAFEALPPGELDALLRSPARLNELLRYHLVSGRLSGPEVADAGVLTTSQGDRVGVRDDGGRILVNDAELIAPNLLSTNAIIHAVDAVLMPPTGDVLETLDSLGTFSTLVGALDAAGLTGTLSGPGPLTLFAPTDAAFEALPPGVLDLLLADPEALRRALLVHVVPGEAASTVDLLARGFAFNILYRVVEQDGRPTIRFQGIPAYDLPTTSTIIVENVPATNGLIQVVDAVLPQGRRVGGGPNWPT